MSRTLFKYIFKDLFRIFMMASGALAGIMSFGGLLRPLTREGLDASQVGRMLTYFTPAMTTYSFPVAALFATAVVYGRLSADNELTAARASGISLLSLSIAGPALVLGLLVALASLLFLCFIVPDSTLKVEKVIYSNLAKFIQGQIERNHEIRFETLTIFAQEAYLPPASSVPKGQQQVVLIGPTIVSVERPIAGIRDYRVPKEFYTASRAIVYIQPKGDGDELEVNVRLEGGFKFPRRYEGAVEAGVSETSYGPFEIPSPIKEDTKFMDVWRLKEVYNDITLSKKIKRVINKFILSGQKTSFLNDLATDLNGPDHRTVFQFEDGERYTITWNAPVPAAVRGGDLIARIAPPAGAQSRPAEKKDEAQIVRPATFVRERNGVVTSTMHAGDISLRAAKSDVDKTVMDVTLDLRDCLTESPQGPIYREHFVTGFSVPMTEQTRNLASQGLSFWESPAAANYGDQRLLLHEKTQFLNEVVAESNGRASFAISCLILVMVGCALGMMFKSGNFLTAFAVSFIPALLSITLIIAGQRTASNIPVKFDGTNNPLQVGLTLIWAGNAVNLVLACGLLWRLQRK